MRLIDADEMDVNDLPFTQGQCRTVRDWLALRNTVDARPAVHAHWEYGNDGYGNEHYYCSMCCTDALNDDDGEYLLSHYCPECGAKMDEEVKHG